LKKLRHYNINMKIIIFSFHCLVAHTYGQGINFGQFNSERKPNTPPSPPPGSRPQAPPPPPGFQGVSLGGAANPGQQFKPASDTETTSLTVRGTKWVYCKNSYQGNASWKEVTERSCPSVFVDPDFKYHDIFCSPYGGLHKAYGGGTYMWLFDPSDPSTLFKYCGYMPSCFCDDCS